MNKVKVDGREIGGERAFIIAEIGSNHNQSLDLAYESIDAAVECGADAVKFQSIKLDQLYFKPSEQTKILHRKIDMDEKWHRLLSDYCKEKNIIFFSAPTYLAAVDILEEINVPLYKLASAQIGTFPQIVEKVVSTGKPVILSTGIVTADELFRVVEVFKLHKNEQLIILHCNSIYPTPYDKVYLSIMNRYREKYDCIVGFSDHTPDIYVPIAAVAMGAKVIEKHFALDRNLPVPDAQFSLEPASFRRMIEGIRAVEQAILTGDRSRLEPEEACFKQSILYRLVAKNDLIAGENIHQQDFDFLRHSEGIDCRDLQNLLDNNAKYITNLKKGDLVHYKHISL